MPGLSGDAHILKQAALVKEDPSCRVQLSITHKGNNSKLCQNKNLLHSTGWEHTTPRGREISMVHDTKSTHFEPPGFEPTPGSPQAECMPTMILRRCGIIYCILPISTEGASKSDVRGVPAILGVQTPDETNLRCMHYRCSITGSTGYARKQHTKEGEAGSSKGQESLHFLLCAVILVLAVFRCEWRKVCWIAKWWLASQEAPKAKDKIACRLPPRVRGGGGTVAHMLTPQLVFVMVARAWCPGPWQEG